MKKTIILLFVIIIVSAAVTVFLFVGNRRIPEPTPTVQKSVSLATPTPTPTLTQAITPSVVMQIDVPFTPQAPFAQWSDPRQQDGCEEAAVLMAMHWARAEPIASREKALQELLALSYYQEKTFGEYRDTSAEDTASRLLKGYYQYTDFQVKRDISVEDIIDELYQGHIVIVPANGRALNNPHFTPPGPERHMMVIIGYDSDTHEFITNDPGTRQGKSYRYDKDILFNAIRDYPTGYHIPIERINKVMIVIGK